MGRTVARLLLLAALSGRALALDQSHPLSSYLQTHFTREDGLPSGIVDSLVESKDGFLWLIVNGDSLTRFDGRHFTHFDQPAHARAMVLAPNGDLWVGTRDGLERIPAAALNQFGHLPSFAYHPLAGKSSNINCLHFSRDGALWVGTTAGLYRFDGGAFLPVIPRLQILRMEEALNGHILAITSQGFMEWDGSRVVRRPEIADDLGVKAGDLFDVMEDSHGVIWFCTAAGVARRVGGQIEKLEDYGAKERGAKEHGALHAYEGPRGNIWVDQADGLYRATASGLELVAPGMNAKSMYGDGDGNLWIGTNGDGLYRFRNRAVRMFTKSDGLPNNRIITVLATADGGLWTGANCGGLSRYDGERFQTYDVKDGLLNSCVWALAEDANHDLWIGTYGGGAFRFRDGRFTQFSKSQGFPSDIVTSVVAGRDRSLWFATHGGVTRMRNGEIRNYTTADGLSSNVALRLYEDKAGSIWVGTNKGLDRMEGDRFVEIAGLPNGAVFPIGEDGSGGLYVTVTPNAGILRIDKKGAITPVSTLEPTGMAETAQGDLWLSGNEVVRVPAHALEQVRAADEPLDYGVLGAADGLTSTECSLGQPNSTLTRDGKLWLATTQGLAMVDLATLPRTDRKPAIYIEATTVGRDSRLPGYGLELPPGTHHIELQFDAIELSSPEKIRLQYRLDGVDSEWLDAGHPAQATYSNIPPGSHSFHIRASNSAGVWDRAGTVYSITQQPYTYETGLFQLAAIGSLMLFIFGVHRLRVWQIAARMNARFDERMAERTRTARDLQDALLQDFQGALTQFDAVGYLLSDRPEAREALESAIEQARQAIGEGRDTVHGVRSNVSSDIAHAIAAFGEGLAASLAGQNCPQFRIHVEGTPENLLPIVQDGVYRIACEALRNAFRHAHAGRIEAEIVYGKRQLRLRVRDDGKGLDPSILGRGGRAGHFGLAGMHERAKLLRGELTVFSTLDSGTELELTVPGAAAYVKPGVEPWPMSFGKGV